LDIDAALPFVKTMKLTSAGTPVTCTGIFSVDPSNLYAMVGATVSFITVGAKGAEKAVAAKIEKIAAKSTIFLMILLLFCNLN
jgi:hypothetical protein